MKKIIAICICMMTVFGVTATATSTNRMNAPTVWPSFEMTYRIEGYYRGLNGSFGTQRYKLVYKNAEHWTSEVLEPAQSTIILPGTRFTYIKNGRTEQTIKFDPLTQKETIAISYSDAVQLSNEWARPGYIDHLIGRTSARVLSISKPSEISLIGFSSIPIYRKAVFSEQSPCDEDRENAYIQRKIVSLKPCLDSRVERHEVIFDSVLNLMVEYSSYVDDVLVEHFVVERLAIK